MRTGSIKTSAPSSPPDTLQWTLYCEDHSRPLDTIGMEPCMTDSGDAQLTVNERRTLEGALDALLPPDGSFPAPSETDMVDEFILKQIPSTGEPPPYPGLDLDGLREIIAELAGHDDMTAALQELEQTSPTRFHALWALAVFGYYSRPTVTGSIQSDLAPGYHGAPLPLGYAHVIAPWDAADPRQMPSNPPGTYIATAEVQRVDLSRLDGDEQ